MKLEKTFTSELNSSTLFEAWISPEMTIEPVSKIESKAVVGGHYKLYAEAPDATHIMNGEFLEIIPNKKLRYTWHWEGTEEHTEILVEFEDDSGGSIVRLEHSGFDNEESLMLHDSGWDHYFEGLVDKIQDN